MSDIYGNIQVLTQKVEDLLLTLCVKNATLIEEW